MWTAYMRAKAADTRRRKRAQADLHSLCRKCFTPLQVGEVHFCADCLKRRAAMRKARREYPSGVCPRCGNAAAEGRSLCFECAAKDKSRALSYYDERRRALILDVLVKAGQPVGSEALRQRTKLRRKTLSRVLAVLVAEGSVQLHDPVAYSFLEAHV